MSVIEDLHDFGVRFAATPTHRKVADYLMTKIQDLGLETIEESFEFRRYYPETSSVELRMPHLVRELRSEPLQYSGNGSIVAEAVFVGDGLSDTYDDFRLDVAQKVVISTYPFPFV